MNPTTITALNKVLNRRDDTNKYNYGHVLVIGGSPGFVGAPLLVANAALRSGAGLVTIASSPEIIDKLEERVEAVMTWRIPADNPLDALQKFAAERRITTLVIGPGMDTNQDTLTLIREIICGIHVPIVVDAGAIGAFRDQLLVLAQIDHPLILTPHAGEFEKLTGTKLPAKREDWEESARDLTKTCNIHLALKGPHTLVMHPDSECYHNTTGNPGLATAGTGDVLSGVIAGLLAQGLTPTEASETGVYLHGLAGDLAASELTEPGVVASDLEHFIPKALKAASKNLSPIPSSGPEPPASGHNSPVTHQRTDGYASPRQENSDSEPGTFSLEEEPETGSKEIA